MLQFAGSILNQLLQIPCSGKDTKPSVEFCSLTQIAWKLEFKEQRLVLFSYFPKCIIQNEAKKLKIMGYHFRLPPNSQIK